MGKYSKSKLVGKRYLIILGIILSIILLIGIGIYIYISVVNDITYVKVNDDSLNVSNDVASNSTPIVINNVVMGGIYENQFVSSERYFTSSKNKEDFEVDMFYLDGKAGTFKLKNITRNDNNIYATTTRTINLNEYIAVKSNTASLASTIKVDIEDKYISYVKDALGIYGLLNSDIKIQNVYHVILSNNETAYIIVASNKDTKNGAFSCVVLSDNSGNKLLKYNYVKNVKNASNFGIIDLKFVIDLNNDGIKEIILQETDEFNTKYICLSNINNKYTQVLSSELKLK